MENQNQKVWEGFEKTSEQLERWAKARLIETSIHCEFGQLIHSVKIMEAKIQEKQELEANLIKAQNEVWEKEWRENIANNPINLDK